MEKLETKQNAAARIITGCCPDTKTEHLLAELDSVFLYERNLRLTEDVPARKVAEHNAQRHRLKKKGPDGKVIKPSQEKDQNIVREIGLPNISREEALICSSVEPHNWKCCHVNFKPQLEGCSGENDNK